MCIIMLAIFLLLITSERSIAGYADSSSNGGYGYGYSGSFSGNNPSNGVPDFEGFLNGYFDSFRKYHEQFLRTRNNSVDGFSLVFSSPNANVTASSSISFTKKTGLQQQAGQFASHVPNPDDIMNKIGEHTNKNPNIAFASASIGPGGGYQNAAIFPENPNNPNIFSRFGETSPKGGGNYGVFTSSVSSSSNVNGKPQTFRSASTTINDNGKISTYTVKDP